MTLEQKLRAMTGISKVNLFRNKVRGGWEASVAREGSVSTFSVGVDDDPVAAILKALDGAAPTFRVVEKAVPAPKVEEDKPKFSGGIFG